MESGGTAPYLLNFGSRSRSVLSVSRPGHFIPWGKSLVLIECEGEWDLVIRLKSIRDSSEVHVLAYLGYVQGDANWKRGRC